MKRLLLALVVAALVGPAVIGAEPEAKKKPLSYDACDTAFP